MNCDEDIVRELFYSKLFIFRGDDRLDVHLCELRK